MAFLSLIYWLAGAGALGLFLYLGYALLCPEKF
ncbi:MAG: potassium-transporting ATPase subunit F [Brachymonas sp.]